jgi:general secretion pathway protein L
MHDLAANMQHMPAINLLQGKYAVKKAKFPQSDKMWKLMAAVAVAWVLLLFLYPAFSYFILRQRVSSIESQITQIYKRHFPQASSVVMPKARMEEKLRKFSAQAGESRFLLLLGYVGKGMLETPSIKLKRLDFQNGQLTMELTATSSEDFSAFSDFLTRQGLNVKQRNANLVGERVNAILEIES